MVERFQRLGMGFGADTNAHTSFKETVYKLELPRVDEKMFTEAFRAVPRCLDGMLLGQDEIDKERGVTLSEKLARDAWTHARWRRVTSRHAGRPAADAACHRPGGHHQEDDAAPLRGFYEKWYAPKRAVVVVVGDVDIPLVEKLIQAHFSDAKGAPW